MPMHCVGKNRNQMFSKIKNYIRFRRQRKETAALSALSSAFDSLAKLERGGLITFDVKNRRLFIEESLASVMLVSPLNWQNFIQNVFLWLYWRQCREAWESFMLKEEMKSVHRAQRKYAVLKHADIMRIRQARRDEIAQADMQPPKVEPFEFFVIRNKVESKDEKDKRDIPSGEILAVGNYDYDRDSLIMADWHDVQNFISRNS